jgi:hypothetical protein
MLSLLVSWLFEDSSSWSDSLSITCFVLLAVEVSLCRLLFFGFLRRPHCSLFTGTAIGIGIT